MDSASLALYTMFIDAVRYQQSKVCEGNGNFLTLKKVVIGYAISGSFKNPNRER